MFKELDPLLHSQLRLAVMSILLSVEEADFVYLKEKTNATAGNLSVKTGEELLRQGNKDTNKKVLPVKNLGQLVACPSWADRLLKTMSKH